MGLEHTPTSFSLQEKGCPRKELGVFQPNCTGKKQEMNDVVNLPCNFCHLGIFFDSASKIAADQHTDFDSLAFCSHLKALLFGLL